MKCENCGKNPATVHTKIVVNGEVTEKMLCTQCWAAESEKMQQPFTLSDLFKGILQPSGAEKAASPECPTCGMDLKTYRQTGLLGCPDCYGAFGASLEPTLIKIHGKARHTGKRPAGRPEPVAEPSAAAEPAPQEAPAPKASKLSEGLTDLRRQLAEAVANEDYEAAAVLRDRIKELTACQEGSRNG